MRTTAALTCVGSLYAGALWMEYQTAMFLGIGCLLVAGASGLGLLAAALWRAPEGGERTDGFHVRPRNGRSRFVPALRPQRQIRRGWT